MAPSRRTKKKAVSAGATASAAANASVGASASGGAPGGAEVAEVPQVAQAAPEGDARPNDNAPGAGDDDERAEERCPACTARANANLAGDKETWIQCDACKTWFHWHCAGNGGDALQVDKWSV